MKSFRDVNCPKCGKRNMIVPPHECVSEPVDRFRAKFAEIYGPHAEFDDELGTFFLTEIAAAREEGQKKLVKEKLWARVCVHHKQECGLIEVLMSPVEPGPDEKIVRCEVSYSL